MIISITYVTVILLICKSHANHIIFLYIYVRYSSWLSLYMHVLHTCAFLEGLGKAHIILWHESMRVMDLKLAVMYFMNLVTFICVFIMETQLYVVPSLDKMYEYTEPYSVLP